MKTQFFFKWQIGFLIAYNRYDTATLIDFDMYSIEIKIPFVTIVFSFEGNPFKLFYEWLQELGKNCPKETKW